MILKEISSLRYEMTKDEFFRYLYSYFLHDLPKPLIFHRDILRSEDESTEREPKAEKPDPKIGIDRTTSRCSLTHYARSRDPS
jgi:hypothetical protein